MALNGKTVLITGGTGSLGRTLVRRLLRGDMGKPQKIVVFSRDEAKQHDMRVEYKSRDVAGEDLMYHNFPETVEFRIGDVRSYASVVSAVRDAHVVFNTAALKQVPSSEYFPFEAIQTNILGAENIVRAVREANTRVELVVGISTDKACKPVNVMGMTKALQERVFLSAGLTCPNARFVCVRYGNVLASRGSVIPLFLNQIANGGPVTVTDPDMTRFLLSLDEAVDLIFSAVSSGRNGETYVPLVPSARVEDIAAALVGDKPVSVVTTGIRPGEKLHEVLISEEEANRTVRRGSHLVIRNILPEFATTTAGDLPWSGQEYSSGDSVMSREDVSGLFERHRVSLQSLNHHKAELLR